MDATGLGTGDSVAFDGGAETDGTFWIEAGQSADTITGGAKNDLLYLNNSSANGDDTVTGGGGQDVIQASSNSADHDTFVYNSVSDSTSTHCDVLTHVDFDNDVFEISSFAIIPTAIDVYVTSGSLSTSTFDSDLASDIGSSRLGAHHAVLFTPSAGTDAGVNFLIVDVNGTAGYQAGQDLVIALSTGANAPTGTLSTSDFG